MSQAAWVLNGKLWGKHLIEEGDDWKGEPLDIAFRAWTREHPSGDKNLGVEFLAWFLGGSDEIWKPGMSNTDHDVGVGGVLVELCDYWGNPLVFIPSITYELHSVHGVAYVTSAGKVVYPEPRRCPKSDGSGEVYCNPTLYQLYSMGPDGLPNTDDDILGEARLP